jgi:hypothetical protein
MPSNFFKLIFDRLLSPSTKERSEKIILTIAIISFLIHLLLIFLVDINVLSIKSELLKNPIAAIYTPFSFILVYEVYLLAYYLPRSITTYVSKQYEIITLIIIRRLFKDLSTLALSSDWFKIKYDLQFTYDLIASVLLFYLLYLFYLQSQKNYKEKNGNEIIAVNIEQFIHLKKIIAGCLVITVLVIGGYSFVNWMLITLREQNEMTTSFKNINNIFFDKFFTILIVVDVILLLFSFFNTDQFHKVIRNSGFVISTILIRLSFSVSGLISTVLIVVAIVFGLLILAIHNKFEQHIIPKMTTS